MPDMGSEFAALRSEVHVLRGDISGLRGQFERKTTWLRRAVGLLAVVIVLLVVGGVRDIVQRNEDRQQARCDIRSAFVELANAAEADPDLVLSAVRSYDENLGTSGCFAVSQCRDGSYSQATGAQCGPPPCPPCRHRRDCPHPPPRGPARAPRPCRRPPG